MTRKKAQKIVIWLVLIWLGGIALFLSWQWLIAKVSFQGAEKPSSTVAGNLTSTAGPTLSLTPAIPFSHTAVFSKTSSVTPSITSSSTPTPSQTSSVTPSPTPTSSSTKTIIPSITLTRTITKTPTLLNRGTPSEYFYVVMVELLDKIVGSWVGLSSVSVNRQSRTRQPVNLDFHKGCQIGQICGTYHWETGCFGNLVLEKMSKNTLYFRSQVGSISPGCYENSLYTIKVKPGDKLSLTISFINEEGKRISKSVTLVRR